MGTLLQDGIDAAKSGRMEEALQFLRRSAEENPQNADVWVWLSAIIDDEEKQTEFLQKALEIDPENKPAQRGMAFLKRKKFIAPKPGETLSDHTRPIGVFKTGGEKPVIQQPVVPLLPIDEQDNQEPLSENSSDYDPDTENTIPPDQAELNKSENQVEVTDVEEKVSSDSATAIGEVLIIDETTDLNADGVESTVTNDLEQPEVIPELAASDADDLTKTPPEEALGDQATQVSPVIATAVAAVDEEAQEEIEPELDPEAQVSTEKGTEHKETPSSEKKPKEHPLMAEAKRLKWQLLLYGLILTAFVVIGILVGSTLKNLISPQKQSLSMNIEPIAKQNGVFLLEGQEFRRLNILKEFPSEDAGLVITNLEMPQIILKDQIVTETSKLKLLDVNKASIATKIRTIDATIPVLEPDSTLTAGRYCISYVLGSSESQAVYWCFVIN
jgi:tetratricopeptide (TPR) repeat protein